MLTNIYIGSNNDTKELELTKIEKTVAKYFEGFTLIPATGYWKGEQEKSVIVQIESDEERKINRVAKVLKRVLKQDAIAIQRQPSLEFV